MIYNFQYKVESDGGHLCYVYDVKKKKCFYYFIIESLALGF